MRRIALCLALCAMLLASRALAWRDAEDAHMAGLAFLSQKDERVAETAYNNRTLGANGCAPASVANAVIGAFGVRDQELAASLVREMSRLLVPAARRGKAIADVNLLEGALSVEARRAQAEAFPAMAAVVGGYAGETHVSPGRIDSQGLIADAAAGRMALYAGRTFVYEGLDEVVALVRALSEAGRDDMFVYLCYVGGGKREHDAPLRSGKSGHYLSLAFPVGAFWREGVYYVIDSLPRALAGEPVREEGPYTTAYAFAEGGRAKDRRFREIFSASRVTPTVIRLAPTPQARAALEEALAAGAGEAQALHAEQMREMVLFGRGVLLANTAPL